MTNTAKKSVLEELAGLVRSVDMGSDASRLNLRITRLLAHGRPVTGDQVDAVIDELGIDKTQALENLTAYAERDDNGDIIGAAPGITLRPTPHRITTDTAQVWAWCAGDTVILPMVLNQQARVEITSPKSKEIVRFTATPHGVLDVEPAGAVVSSPLLIPGANPTDGGRLALELSEVTTVEQIWGAICNHGHAFGSLAEGQEFFAGRDHIMFLSLSEVFDLLRGFADTLLAHEQQSQHQTPTAGAPS